MQNVNKGHSGTKRSRRYGQPERKNARNGEVSTITVNPVLWRLGLAFERLLVIDSETVIYCNSRRHRDYLRKVMRRG